MSRFKPCSVDGCNGNAHRDAGGRNGWCRKHYTRQRLYGDPLGGRTPDGEPLAFLDAALVCGDDGCISWPYNKSSNGYGQIKIDGRPCGVHRYVCERVHGPAPMAEYQAAHECGNRACINPRHISWKTPAENCSDRIIHGTHSRGEKNWNCTITETQAKEIMSLRGKLTQKKIADRVGASIPTVRNIHEGKSWAWLLKGAA